MRNASADSVAVRIHDYSPPPALTRYELAAGGLAVRATETEADW